MRRTVIAVVDDMIFASKIRGAAQSLDVDVIFVRTIDQLMNAPERLNLIVVDLHSQRINALDVAMMAKADEKLRSVELLGFFSHVETELQRQALAAGYDTVVPRSVFSRDLAQIIGAEN